MTRPDPIRAFLARECEGNPEDTGRAEDAYRDYVERGVVPDWVPESVKAGVPEEDAANHIRNALQILIPDSRAAITDSRERDIIAARARLMKALTLLETPQP